MAEGTVKWFDRGRGFGYITPDLGEREVFVSFAVIAAPVSDGFRSVSPGRRVCYRAREGTRGPEAVYVRALP